MSALVKLADLLGRRPDIGLCLVSGSLALGAAIAAWVHP